MKKSLKLLIYPNKLPKCNLGPESTCMFETFKEGQNYLFLTSLDEAGLRRFGQAKPEHLYQF